MSVCGSPSNCATLPAIVYIGAVRELQQVRVTNDAISIGAAVTLTDAWQAIVAHFPTLADLAQRFASPPVCNSGTLGGNVANGSPVGDSMPALIALGARVELRRGAHIANVATRRFLPRLSEARICSRVSSSRQ